jgi:hypothetical protein
LTSYQDHGKVLSSLRAVEFINYNFKKVTISLSTISKTYFKRKFWCRLAKRNRLFQTDGCPDFPPIFLWRYSKLLFSKTSLAWHELAIESQLELDDEK